MIETTATSATAAKTLTMPSSGRAERRADLDFMRAFVVLGLILLHSAMPFADTDWFVDNGSANVGFVIFILWGAAWGMPLLFMVSGMGIRYALRTRSGGEFLKERVKRLLVPFLFGLLVLIPPMFYLAFLGEAGFHDSYARFWIRLLDPRPILRGLPALYEWNVDGRAIDPAHLWFLYYLLLYSVGLLPLFVYLRRSGGARFVDRMAAFVERRGAIFLLAIPLVLLEAALGTNENTGGWNRSVYAFLLLYGFLMASDRRFEASMRRHRRSALALGIVSFLLIVAWGAVFHDRGIDQFHAGGAAVAWRALKAFCGWAWLVAIIGYAGEVMASRRRTERSPRPRTAGRPAVERGLAHRWARYANEAVLPFYALHETVIVLIAFWLVRLHVGMVPKYFALVATSFIGTLALYEFGVRRTRPTRFLFGMKSSRDQSWGLSRSIA